MLAPQGRKPGSGERPETRGAVGGTGSDAESVLAVAGVQEVCAAGQAPCWVRSKITDCSLK